MQSHDPAFGEGHRDLAPGVARHDGFAVEPLDATEAADRDIHRGRTGRRDQLQPQRLAFGEAHAAVPRAVVVLQAFETGAARREPVHACVLRSRQ